MALREGFDGPIEFSIGPFFMAEPDETLTTAPGHRLQQLKRKMPFSAD